MAGIDPSLVQSLVATESGRRAIHTFNAHGLLACEAVVINATDKVKELTTPYWPTRCYLKSTHYLGGQQQTTQRQATVVDFTAAPALVQQGDTVVGAAPRSEQPAVPAPASAPARPEVAAAEPAPRELEEMWRREAFAGAAAEYFAHVAKEKAGGGVTGTVVHKVVKNGVEYIVSVGLKKVDESLQNSKQAENKR